MRALVSLAIALVCAACADAITVCIDPGHGGSDAGAVGAFYTEKAACLDAAFAARDWLQQTPGVTWVALTRSSDVFVSLADRVAYANANGFDRFVSIHHNAFDGSVQGTETYAYTYGSAASFDLRDRVQSRLLWSFAYADRGAKTADYYVLHYTVMPAVLGEASFIDYAGAYDESQRFASGYMDHAGREGYGYCWGFADHAGLVPPPYVPGGETAVADPSAPHGLGVTARHAAGGAVALTVQTGAPGEDVALVVVNAAGLVLARFRGATDGRGAFRVAWRVPHTTASGVCWIEARAKGERAAGRFVLLR